MGVDAVRRIVRHDELAKIDARPAVGRQSHDLPFVAVSLETEVIGELRVEKAKRVGPGNRQDMVEMAAVAIPDGSSFPGAPAIHDYDGRFGKTRERKGA